MCEWRTVQTFVRGTCRFVLLCQRGHWLTWCLTLAPYHDLNTTLSAKQPTTVVLEFKIIVDQKIKCRRRWDQPICPHFHSTQNTFSPDWITFPSSFYWNNPLSRFLNRRANTHKNKHSVFSLSYTLQERITVITENVPVRQTLSARVSSVWTSPGHTE